MIKRRIETYSIKEFMNRGKETVIKSKGFEFKEEVRESLSVLGTISLIPLAIKPLFASTSVMASESITVNAIPANTEMYDKMVHAFDPLIELIQAIAYPIAMIVVLGGAIMVMLKQDDKGYSMMMSAGLGYVLVQLTPMVLNILVQAMKAI